jgi:4-amino-4-deoxychorismate lyase
MKLEDGEIFNLKYHQERICAAFAELFPDRRPLNLEDTLSGTVFLQTGLFRLRVSYDRDSAEITVSPYVRRMISRLIIIEDNGLGYPYKFEDRSLFAKYAERFAEDEEPLFAVGGRICDTTFGNAVFRKNGVYFTPRSFLLKGTMRTQLLEDGVIREADITVDNITDFSEVHIINALNGIGDIAVDVKNVVYL